jgi:hypothetical protein
MRDRRGITVLTLLLLIIAVVIAAVFLVRYLRSRPAVSEQTVMPGRSPDRGALRGNGPGFIASTV